MPLTEDTVLVSPEYLDKYNRLVVSTQIDSAANAVHNYSAANLLGQDSANYDMSSVTAEVFVLDNDASSPTNGYFISAVAVASIGIKTDGSVRIANTFGAAIRLLVRIHVRRKAYQG